MSIDMTRSVLEHRTAQAVSADLAHAIISYEVYQPSGKNKSLIQTINARALNPAFNVISDSLHRTVLLTLCRIWDRTKGTCSVHSLELSMAKREDISKITLFEWREAKDAISRSDELNAILAARNMFIAHTKAPNKTYEGRARLALYGDERVIIERSIDLVERANNMIGYGGMNFGGLRQIWIHQSEKFWQTISPDST